MSEEMHRRLGNIENKLDDIHSYYVEHHSKIAVHDSRIGIIGKFIWGLLGTVASIVVYLITHKGSS